jgi:hypothetical protein
MARLGPLKPAIPVQIRAPQSSKRPPSMRTFVRMDASLPSDELHWLAGLLEGEGSFMTGPPSNPRMPVISVHMTDEDVMARLGRIFARKVHVVSPRNPRWRTTYQVRVQGGNAVRWMTLLRPLMGERRHAQIDRALACYAPRSSAVLTDGMARAALDALASGDSVKVVAARFGVSVWCIYDLRLGRTFKHLVRGAAAGSLPTSPHTPASHRRPRPRCR